MKKVLVIDDDESLTEALEMLLVEEGYQVSVVNDDRKLNGLVREEQPDLVVMDYRLTYRDGIEIAEKLRADPETQKIPILMVSASNNVAQMARKAGIEDFLAKPFEIDTFLGLVRKYCCEI